MTKRFGDLRRSFSLALAHDLRLSRPHPMEEPIENAAPKGQPEEGDLQLQLSRRRVAWSAVAEVTQNDRVGRGWRVVKCNPDPYGNEAAHADNRANSR